MFVSSAPESAKAVTTSGSPEGGKDHLAFLDGLRALAALYVVLHHAYFNLDFTAATGLLKTAATMLNLGRFAVDFFIVISGFCLMLPVIRNGGHLRNGSLIFFKRRAVRILPPYWLAVCFSLVLIWLYIGQKTGSHWDWCVPLTWKSVISHVLLVHDVVHENYTLNHSLWSIAVEWRIYFFFPLLLLLWRRVGSLVTVCFACVLGVVVLYLFMKWWGTDLTSHYLGLFAFGMLGAETAFGNSATSRWLRMIPWRLTIAVSTIALAILIETRLPGPEFITIVIRDMVMGIAATGVLVVMSLNPQGIAARAVSGRLLCFIGSFAYSLYLIHAPLLQVYWQATHWLFNGRSPWLELGITCIVGIPLMVAISYVFYLFCERPFLFSKKRTSTSLAAPAVEVEMPLERE